MAKAKQVQFEEVFEQRGDMYVCKLCAMYETALINKARNHAIVKHAQNLAPVVTVVAKRGKLEESPAIIVVETLLEE